MATYVMSDIHGCYTEMMALIDKIGIDLKADTLIISGDLIDRGLENKKMLRFIEDHPDNVIILKGNHEQMFSKYCGGLIKLSLTLSTENLKDLIKNPLFKDYVFDAYNTVEDLIRNNNNLTLSDFERWHDLIEDLPYVKEVYIEERDEYFVVVHGGWITYDAYKAYRHAGGKLSKNNFYLWARGEEAIRYGGETQAITVHGHTPSWSYPYNLKGKARVMMYETKNPTKRFINIDCGIAYKDDYKNANLACLRLEDMKAFYLY